MTYNDFDVPTVSTEEMQRMMNGELSLTARLAYVALMLVSLGATVAIASLWATEASLPMRTQIAFALMVAIGLSWVAYSTWVLTRRRVLFAGHRIIAARMAVGFSALFAAGFALLAILGQGGRAAAPAAGTGLVMLAVAIALLIHARRRFAQLQQRREILERELQRKRG